MSKFKTTKSKTKKKSKIKSKAVVCNSIEEVVAHFNNLFSKKSKR